MWGAEVMWGLMAPVSKLVLASAVTPLLLTDCRMLGAACLFWLASVFTKPEHVASKDLLLLFFASLLGIEMCIRDIYNIIRHTSITWDTKSIRRNGCPTPGLSPKSDRSYAATGRKDNNQTSGWYNNCLLYTSLSSVWWAVTPPTA